MCDHDLQFHVVQFTSRNLSAAFPSSMGADALVASLSSLAIDLISFFFRRSTVFPRPYGGRVK